MSSLTSTSTLRRHRTFSRQVHFASATTRGEYFEADKFNAGVMVLRPCQRTFEAMLKLAPSAPSHDGGDTGFLNTFFSQWYLGPPATRLPFRYNAQRTLYWMTSARQPGYWDIVKPIKVLHFSSNPKPWDCVSKKGELEMLWWDYYTHMTLGAAPSMRLTA